MGRIDLHCIHTSFDQHEFHHPDPTTLDDNVVVGIYLALLSTVLANVILYLLIGNRSVSRLSIQLYIVPLVSLVGGIVLLGEGVTILTVLGAILMFTGVALATRKN